jgi:hypothetical protein
MVGDRADIIPPKLVLVKDNAGKSFQTWDRPNAFGPVPQKLQASGDLACLSVRVDLFALGYHPMAQDVNGKPISGGAFFCGLKPNGDQPDSKPPRLVREKDTVAWDRPAAFGRVPKAEYDRGRTLCQTLGSDFVPIGFHPEAEDEQGKAIAGGGFFCAKAR